MNASMLNTEENQPRVQVSILTRLLAALSFTIPAIGAALSSILLINVMRALRENESAGISVVMAGMKEASLPVIVSLYLAAICGIIVIIVLVVRMIVQTNTASPPSWFFAIVGILFLIPAGLFWKAQLLILEAINPGSSIGAGGAESAGATVSQLLIWSVIAAPIVFIILVVASVIPFSLRSRPKWLSLFTATAIEVLLISSAIAIPFLINEPKRQKETVNLPENVKDADIDSYIYGENSIILTLTSDNKLYLKQKNNAPDKVKSSENIITNEELPEKLKSSMKDKTPDKRIVFFKCDVNASFENVLQVFDFIRKADIDRVGLVVIGEKNADDPYQISPLSFEVKLSAPVVKSDVLVKPNPNILVAVLESDGSLSLNSENMGMISNAEKLENVLSRVFRERENHGVFREGTNEIEKTVFLKVSKSSKYSDFVKLVEAVKLAGAQPLVIQIDDIKPDQITRN